MNECKILTFDSIYLRSRNLKNIPGVNHSYTIRMNDYPVIEQEINAYLRAGFKIQNISRTPNDVLTVLLVR